MAIDPEKFGIAARHDLALSADPTGALRFAEVLAVDGVTASLIGFGDVAWVPPSGGDGRAQLMPREVRTPEIDKLIGQTFANIGDCRAAVMQAGVDRQAIKNVWVSRARLLGMELTNA